MESVACPRRALLALLAWPDLEALGIQPHPPASHHPRLSVGRRMAQGAISLSAPPFPHVVCDLLIFVCFEPSGNLVLSPHPTPGTCISVALEVCYLDLLSICPALRVAVLHAILFKNKVEKVTTK